MITITPEYVQQQAAIACLRHPERVNLGHKAIVEAGGGVYRPGLTFGTHVTFDSPATGSTLLILESLLTPEEVTRKITESNRQYGL